MTIQLPISGFLFLVLRLPTTVVFGFSASSNNPQDKPPSQGTQQQLSWQDLGETLLSLQDSGVPDEALVSSRLSNLSLSRVRVGPSQVGSEGDAALVGRGLFATMDCQEGDLLTCFPGDVLIQPSGIQIPDDYTKYFEKDQDTILRDYLARYCIGLTEDLAVMGLPELDQDMAYAGHLINDGIATPPHEESQLEDYMRQSQEIANAAHIPLENLHMVTLATKDIKKDEEILVTYGPVYWMEHKATWRGGDPESLQEQ